MEKRLSSVEKVERVLKSLPISTIIQELPHSTRTAKEAAAAVHCLVDQIVKSLVFQTINSEDPILILTCGSNQVDEKHVSIIIGEEIKFASPAFVREKTGFAIGGVSPYGLKNKIPTYIDQDLLNHTVIWAAAGSHNAVFSIHPRDLVDTTGGIVIAVHQG
ncbi:MAG: YbaK/EbsC family protein [Anaerolineales bacterium]|nr:YbaK/EbsC family protein [Anaerolineales bacterium]